MVLVLNLFKLRSILRNSGLSQLLSQYFGWIIYEKHNLVLYFYLFLVGGGGFVFFSTCAMHIPYDNLFRNIFIAGSQAPIFGAWFVKILDNTEKFNQHLPKWHTDTLEFYRNPYLSTNHWYYMVVIFILPYISLYKVSSADPGKITNENIQQHLKSYDYDYIIFHDKFCTTCLLQK